MIVYIENPKESTDEFLEILSEFKNMSRLEVNIQKLMLFLYISNK